MSEDIIEYSVHEQITYEYIRTIASYNFVTLHEESRLCSRLVFSKAPFADYFVILVILVMSQSARKTS